MNPILQAMNELSDDKRQLISIIVDNKIKPTSVTLHFDDGTASHVVVSTDRETFMEHYKEASAYVRETGKIQPLEKLD